MKLSTLFLGFTVVVLAGALALLWQAFVAPRPAPATKRETPPQVAANPTNPAPPLRRSEPEDPGVRSVYPGGRPSAAKPPPQREESPSPAARTEPAAPQERTAKAEPPPAPSAVPLDEAPASAEGVDLNTAPLEQLNALGAGMIGKTIIANRPYAAPEDLLAKRVLNRRDFETIKPHVTVR